MNKKNKVVFLPGKLCDYRLWKKLTDSLTDIIDPVFVDLSKQDTLNKMLDAVEDSCREPFVLVGFSMGGYVAQEFALRFPEKLLGLSLIGSSADAYSLEEVQYQQLIIETITQHGYSEIPEPTMQKLIHRDNYKNDVLVDLIQDMAKRGGAQALISQYQATMNRCSRLDELKQITCPTIVIASKQDQLVSREAIHKMASLISGAKFYEIESCGHMIPLEEPELLSYALRYWLENIDNKL